MQKRVRQKKMVLNSETKYLKESIRQSFFKKMHEKLLKYSFSDMNNKENKIEKIKSNIGQIVCTFC